MYQVSVYGETKDDLLFSIVLNEVPKAETLWRAIKDFEAALEADNECASEIVDTICRLFDSENDTHTEIVANQIIVIHIPGRVEKCHIACIDMGTPKPIKQVIVKAGGQLRVVHDYD